MRKKPFGLTVLAVVVVFVSCGRSAAQPLDTIDLGVILAAADESHCFMFGGLGLSAEKAAETKFLTGIAHDLAFSDGMTPPWPEWEGVRISAVYGHAGPEASEKFIASMVDPGGVVHCRTLDELFGNCNCVFLVSTGDGGEAKDELVPRCIATGKPLFVDKFLASNLHRARTFIQLAEEHDVRLASASLLWMGQPVQDLKAELGDRAPTKFASTGWGGSNISGDLHPIAHLLSIAGERRPVSVRCEEGESPKAVVLFDDGTVGELVARRPDAIFDLDAECDGTVFHAPYEAKHSRPSAINMLEHFFGFVRGENEGVPVQVMEDSLGVWEAAVKAQATGGTVMLSTAPERMGITLDGLEFRTPVPAIPYYHFAARLRLAEAGPVYVHELTIDGEPERNFFLLEADEDVDVTRPLERRRLAIAGGLKGPRPERSYEEAVFIGRADWRNGETHTVEITASVGSREDPAYWATAEAAAPATGGYWDAGWSHYQSVVVTETAGLDRTREPVTATMLLYPDTVTDAIREFRVVQYDCAGRAHREVPSQVIDSASISSAEAPMYDEHGHRKPATFLPTSSATVVFPADVPARQSGVYLVFYGNPDAPMPAYDTDLEILGAAPGVTVENAAYRLKLHDLTGMLDEVTFKAKPEYTFVHKKETNGAIQWNPGCYAPPRAWVHVSDWEPGKYDYEYEETRGPMTFRTRRWGQMPLMPEITVSMEYDFHAGVPFFVMRSTMRVRHDVDAQALRNAEVVFAREAFSEVGWHDPLEDAIQTRHIVSAPDLTEWTMPDTTPWIAFFDREKGCGFGGIQLGYENGNLMGHLRTLNPYLYVTTGPWIYWTRALAYPYGSRNPQQLVRIETGSVFLEEWAYLPFELGAGDADLLAEMERWQARLAQPLLVHLVEPTDPRMEIPEEIYIEPTKTGWEEAPHEG